MKLAEFEPKISNNMKVDWKFHWMIAIDNFDPWDPSSATPKCVDSKEGLYWKIILIWSHFMRVSWSAYEFTAKPSARNTKWNTVTVDSPVSWGCRIYWLHLYRRLRPPIISVLDMTLRHQMVRLQSWNFGEYGVLLYCHYSLIHFESEWCSTC